MHRCGDGEADLFLDGMPYQFVSAEEAEQYSKRLAGLAGARFTARAHTHWGLIRNITEEVRHDGGVRPANPVS